MTLWRQRLLIFVVPLFLSAPFLNRALFVDDQFFVSIAHWIKDHPTRPYDFPDENGAPTASLSPAAMSARIVNPLLHHYYLALLMRIGGEKEAWLRFGCVLLWSFAGLFVWGLARRWTAHPVWATVLVQAAPACWLTAQGMLIDSTLGFFVFGAVWSAVRFVESGQRRHAVLAGALAGLATLAKYTGVLSWPLVALWWTMNRASLRRRGWTAAAGGIAIALAGGYFAVTKALYGHGHLAASLPGMAEVPGFGKIFSTLVFFAGSLGVPFVAWAAVGRRAALIGGAATVALAALFGSAVGGFSPAQAALLSLFLVTALLFLAKAARWARRVAPADRFLLLWLALFFAMMAFAVPWTAARYFVIAAPAAVFLAVRWTEERVGARAAGLLGSFALGVAILGGAIAFADDRQAESARVVARILRSTDGAARLFYAPQAFTLAYMREAGWRPLPPAEDLRPGDRILLTDVTFPAAWFRRSGVPVRPVWSLSLETKFPIRVMDVKAGAAFYGSAWGPLPFAFSRGPWERFDVVEVVPPPKADGSRGVSRADLLGYSSSTENR